jgi:hypothetical protein
MMESQPASRKPYREPKLYALGTLNDVSRLTQTPDAEAHFRAQAVVEACVDLAKEAKATKTHA